MTYLLGTQVKSQIRCLFIINIFAADLHISHKYLFFLFYKDESFITKWLNIWKFVQTNVVVVMTEIRQNSLFLQKKTCYNLKQQQQFANWIVGGSIWSFIHLFPLWMVFIKCTYSFIYIFTYNKIARAFRYKLCRLLQVFRHEEVLTLVMF